MLRSRRLAMGLRMTCARTMTRQIVRSVPRSRQFSLKAVEKRGGSEIGKAAAADSSAVETSEESPNFFWRNPGYFALAFVFMIFGWFYKTGRDRDHSDSLTKMVQKRRIIVPSEINFLRRSNEIRPDDLEQLHSAVQTHFPDGKATVQEFDKFLIEHLAPKHPAGMKYGYVLERVLLSLPADTHGRIELPLMLIAFSLCIGGDHMELINVLFRIRTANKTLMTNTELESFVDDLLVTDQMPTDRSVVPTIYKYPSQQYTLGDGGDLIRKALSEKDIKERLQTNDNVSPAEAYEHHAEHPDEGWISLADFKVILASQSVCMWGECFGKIVTQRKRWRELGKGKKV